MDPRTATACIAKTFDIMKRLASGQPRPVAEILNDYDEFRRHVSLLATAGVLDEAPHQKTRRTFVKFIQQFNANVETIVTARYATARREFDEAKTAKQKRIVVSDAADELDRLTRYPEHRGHTLLKKVLIALREWEAKLGADAGG